MPKIAIVQKAPVYFNLTKSIEKLKDIIEEAKKNDSDIIAFGETWLCGYPVFLDHAPNIARWNESSMKSIYQQFCDSSLKIESEEFEEIQKTVIKNKVYIILGVNEMLGSTVYNTLIMMNPKGEYKLHRKLMPTYTEKLMYGMGDGSTLEAIDSEWGKIGSLVCWEHWMPLSRAAMHDQNEVIHIAAWPTAHEMHQVASRNYAFEGRTFVLACGQVLNKQDLIDGLEKDNPNYEEILSVYEGIEEENLMTGGSAVIAPNGSYIVEPQFGESKLVYADLDLSQIQREKMTLDINGHYARPDVFTLNVNREENINVK